MVQLQVGQHTSYHCLKDRLKTSDCLNSRIVAKSIERAADHTCSIINKAIKLKDKISFCLKDRENEPACTDSAGRLFKALLGRKTLQDDIVTALENDRVPDLHNINLAL